MFNKIIKEISSKIGNAKIDELEHELRDRYSLHELAGSNSIKGVNN